VCNRQNIMQVECKCCPLLIQLLVLCAFTCLPYNSNSLQLVDTYPFVSLFSVFLSSSTLFLIKWKVLSPLSTVHFITLYYIWISLLLLNVIFLVFLQSWLSLPSFSILRYYWRYSFQSLMCFFLHFNVGYVLDLNNY